MINEALINEEYYRQQLLELAKVISYDSLTIRKLRLALIHSDSLLDECNLLVDKSSVIIDNGSAIIDSMNKENKKRDRRFGISKFANIALGTTTIIATVFILTQ